MTAQPDSPAFAPFFLEGADGPLFCIHYGVPGTTPPRGAVLFVPPFAEEMNRSRRMAVLQARRLAALGFHILLLDLYGTGDSAGDFADARWDGWLDDIRRARHWLQDRSAQPVVLWGLRTGCLLAAAAAQEEQDGLGGLLFWQPVSNGQAFLIQFLRLKIAAAMADGEEGAGDKGLSTKAMRQDLLDGKSLEVAGYELSADLARGLDAARLAKTPPPGVKTRLFEIGQQEEPALSPANQAVVEAWDAAGAELQAELVSGPSFWAIEETTLVPSLWLKTEEALLSS